MSCKVAAGRISICDGDKEYSSQWACLFVGLAVQHGAATPNSWRVVCVETRRQGGSAVSQTRLGICTGTRKSGEIECRDTRDLASYQPFQITRFGFSM